MRHNKQQQFYKKKAVILSFAMFFYTFAGKLITKNFLFCEVL